MAYVTIPKDLDRIKNKVAFGLTLRQIVCLAVGGAIGVPVYFMSRDTIGTSNATLCMVAVMLPAFFLAMYEKDGMPLERVLYNLFRRKYLRPGVRRYRGKRGSVSGNRKGVENRTGKKTGERNRVEIEREDRSISGKRRIDKTAERKVGAVSFAPVEVEAGIDSNVRGMAMEGPINERRILSEINRSFASNAGREKAFVQEEFYEYEYLQEGGADAVNGLRRYVYAGVPSFLRGEDVEPDYEDSGPNYDAVTPVLVGAVVADDDSMDLDDLVRGGSSEDSSRALGMTEEAAFGMTGEADFFDETLDMNEFVFGDGGEKVQDYSGNDNGEDYLDGLLLGLK